MNYDNTQLTHATDWLLTMVEGIHRMILDQILLQIFLMGVAQKYSNKTYTMR